MYKLLFCTNALFCCILDNSAPTPQSFVFFLKQQWGPYSLTSDSGNWALVTAREDALGRNKTLFRLWISKRDLLTNRVMNYVFFFLIPLSFPLVWHPCLHWVCFYWHNSISLKGRFSLRCYFQSLVCKTSETKLDWKTFWKWLRTLGSSMTCNVFIYCLNEILLFKKANLTGCLPSKWCP